MIEVGTASRIERSILLSEEHPDHVWEPQTTKLLLRLADRRGDVLIGGAFLGDHAVPLAAKLTQKGQGEKVHAFEPFRSSFERLVKNINLNELENVAANNVALWDQSGRHIRVESAEGEAPLATPEELETADSISIESSSIDDYLKRAGVLDLSTLMLDMEGGEERTLWGAEDLLTRDQNEAPVIVFEVHRDYTDWSDGLRETSVIRFLEDRGYMTYAVRDIHSNFSMANRAIEVIPADRVYLDGPPHTVSTWSLSNPHQFWRLSISQSCMMSVPNIFQPKIRRSIIPSMDWAYETRPRTPISL